MYFARTSPNGPPCSISLPEGHTITLELSKLLPTKLSVTEFPLIRLGYCVDKMPMSKQACSALAVGSTRVRPQTKDREIRTTEYTQTTPWYGNQDSSEKCPEKCLAGTEMRDLLIAALCLDCISGRDGILGCSSEPCSHNICLPGTQIMELFGSPNDNIVEGWE